DGDEHDAAAVPEQLRVLITVRVHLDGSALGASLEEEGEDDCFAPEVGELDGAAQHSVTRGTAECEVGRESADRKRRGSGRRRGGRRCRWLLGGERGGGEQRRGECQGFDHADPLNGSGTVKVPENCGFVTPIRHALAGRTPGPSLCSGRAPARG